MRARRSLVFALAMVGLGWTASGCSFSASSESSSDSISGSSKSFSDSSTSSSPSDESKSKEAYRDDVRDYTASYAQSAIGMDEFQKGLAEIAEQHGITNWEVDATTYVGIGQGLGRAGVSAERLESFKAALAGARAPDARLIQQGYDASRG